MKSLETLKKTRFLVKQPIVLKQERIQPTAAQKGILEDRSQDRFHKNLK